MMVGKLSSDPEYVFDHGGDLLHYNDHGFVACSFMSEAPKTCMPRRVTCGKCKLTKAYRDMMEPNDGA